MNMILGKRHIILAALVLVLGIAVYLNWTFGGKEGGFSITDQLETGQNYKYPHEYPNHYVVQQYLPDALRDAVYYRYGDNKTEQAAKRYWDNIKGRNGE